MKSLYTAIKSGTEKLPDPNLFEGNEVTIKIEFNGLPYDITYQKEQVVNTTDKTISNKWTFQKDYLAH
jgi:hypothetical protein